jgi:hypothetical protein
LQTGEYGNLLAKGVIDPTKVVRTAIQNASSVAALPITEAMIAELPKKTAPAGGACPRPWAWAWTSKSSHSGDTQEMQNPSSDAGVLFEC